MSKEITFQLDPSGGEEILREMASATIRSSADAIANRARSMASAMTSRPPEITSTTTVGIIRRGIRFYATVKAEGQDSHANYIGIVALSKAKDAGRVA